MSRIPRILPLAGVAVVGVLAINALAGAEGLPALLTGARAFAEEAVKAEAKAGEGEAAAPAETAKPPAAVCAPTAAELAKEAGLSPAELQVLQSLGVRRGELDKREGDLEAQLALMAAAEAKLDAKIRALNGLKGEVQTLLADADAKQGAEIDRLVKIYEGMKAKDAAPRMMVLDDAVRIPIAGRMKERALSAILAAMPAAEAKKLSESLAKRFTDDGVRAAAEAAVAPQTQAVAPAAKAPPRKVAAAKSQPADAGEAESEGG